MILADKIIEERKKNGWTQEELAQKLGVSRQSVSKWESAGAIPDLKKIIQLADLFGVSTDYLLKDEVEKENTETICDTDCELHRVSMEEANTYMDEKKKAAPMLANCRKAYARCASSFLNNVLTNKRLKERGLVFLLDQYNLKHC